MISKKKQVRQRKQRNKVLRTVIGREQQPAAPIRSFSRRLRNEVAIKRLLGKKSFPKFPGFPPEWKDALRPAMLEHAPLRINDLPSLRLTGPFEGMGALVNIVNVDGDLVLPRTGKPSPFDAAYFDLHHRSEETQWQFKWTDPPAPLSGEEVLKSLDSLPLPRVDRVTLGNGDSVTAMFGGRQIGKTLATQAARAAIRLIDPSVGLIPADSIQPMRRMTTEEITKATADLRKTMSVRPTDIFREAPVPVDDSEAMNEFREFMGRSAKKIDNN